MADAQNRPARDWEAIERDYRSGQFTDREIGAKYGLSHAGVQKRARRDGWVKDRTRPSKAPPVAAVSLQDGPQAGFVYVIYQDCADRLYKIGMTASLQSRLNAHQCASPYELRVACVYFAADMRAEEASLHELFADKRVRGEWFRLQASDLQLIAARSLLEVA